MSVGERDNHSGHMTTGHEWNGIKELNTRVPRIVWACLIGSVIISVIMWVIWPTWPIWNTFTPGILKTDERAQLVQEIQQVAGKRSDIDQQIQAITYDGLIEKPELLSQVRSDAHLLFQDNCAACHGVQGKGEIGFPNLTDSAWLWERDEDVIMETLKVGINDQHPDTRTAEMLAFGREGMLERQAIKDVIAYVLKSGETPIDGKMDYGNAENGSLVFEENCASCHGEDAKGDTDIGAPNLIDNVWIYGGDTSSLFQTIWNGRKGHMPSWEGRLSETERKILTLYVMDLESANKGKSK